MSLEKLREHRAIWDAKPALQAAYAVWFDALLADVPPSARVLEVGAGPGFLSAHARRARPDLRWIATDIVPTPWNELVADAQRLPARDGSLHVVAGIDVLHHFARPWEFVAECGRVLRPGGRLLLLEPWVTPFSFPIYRWLHQEGCRPGLDPRQPFGAKDGKEPFEGDGAVPWKLLRVTRDGEWRTAGLQTPRVRLFNGFAWLLTLGFRPPSLLPAPLAPALHALDRLTRPAGPLLGLRALLSWERA